MQQYQYHCPNCGYRGSTQSHYCSPATGEGFLWLTGLGLTALAVCVLYVGLHRVVPHLRGDVFVTVVLCTAVYGGMFWWGLRVAASLQHRWTALSKIPRFVLAIGFVVALNAAVVVGSFAFMVKR